MAPQPNKVSIDPTETKPNQIALLSAGIGDKYILSSTTENVTLDKKNPNKKEKTEIKKEPNIDLGNQILIIMNLIFIVKNMI